MALPNRKQGQQDMFGHPEEDPAGADVIAMPMPETPKNERNANPSAVANGVNLRIGDILKRERERRGYDLQQIADYLCIRRGLLTALENSRYEEFPADAYAIGFLRSYAELLGMKGQDAIDHYRKEMAGRRRKPDLVLPTPVSEGRAPTAVIVGAAVAAALIIYVLWYALSTSDRATVSTPPALPTSVVETTTPTTATPTTTTDGATAATETLPSTAPSGIAIAAPAPTQTTMAPTAVNAAAPATTATNPTPAAAPKPTATPVAHIVIKADQSSWILIANDKGQTVYDHVLKPGDAYPVPNIQGLTLTTGNGAGIVVSLDGVDLPRLSNTSSHIVRNVPLETSALKALPQNPAQ